MIACEIDPADPALAAALASANLPLADPRASGRRFFRFDDDDGLVGYAGVESDGRERLLRSVIVAPDRRRTGLGRDMVTMIERVATDDGARSLYLLTTTAGTFFERLGYRPCGREEAPAKIAASAEFKSLCPATAAFLVKHLDT